MIDVNGYLQQLRLTEMPFGFVKVAEPYDPDTQPDALNDMSPGATFWWC